MKVDSKSRAEVGHKDTLGDPAQGDHGDRGDHGDYFIALNGSSSGQGVKRRLEERPADGILGEELQEQVWWSAPV